MASEDRFAKVSKMLEKAGWKLSRINGSHHIFKKPNATTISIPVHHGKVKSHYVEQVKKLIQ